ncbi:hypothetical protein Bca52824_016224 [Brassica carinata]|uniref:Uncharacterized protein n=1 Tax=Brassica carinata TaxID=52824 RepID=A0A8X7W433_BRACI|nr:hypothetical protein Bca52824_016224 [Brassica carinata]
MVKHSRIRVSCAGSSKPRINAVVNLEADVECSNSGDLTGSVTRIASRDRNVARSSRATQPSSVVNKQDIKKRKVGRHTIPSAPIAAASFPDIAHIRESPYAAVARSARQLRISICRQKKAN